MKKVYSFLLGLVVSVDAFGGNVAAADVSFRCLSGMQYEFTVTSVTLGQPLSSDTISFDFGDGSPVYYLQAPVSVQLSDTSYYQNQWTFLHNYTGAGNYGLLATFPGHAPGIVNIPNSATAPFTLEGEIIADPVIGCNSSPYSTDPELIKTAILAQGNSWNISSLDPDGDSIAHFFIPCNVPGYTFPDNSSSFYIDPVTGQYEWNVPSQPGRFNVVIKTEQWFHMPNGFSILTGYVTREIQINVVPPTGIHETAVPLFSLYPNPATFDEPITVSVISFMGSPRAQLVNGLGQVVWKWEWNGLQANTFSAQLPLLPEGVYLYMLGNENEWIHSELLVIRKP